MKSLPAPRDTGSVLMNTLPTVLWFDFLSFARRKMDHTEGP